MGLAIPTVPTTAADVFRLYLLDIPGCDLERQILQRIYPHSDKRSSTLRRQVFRRDGTTIIVEAHPYMTTRDYPTDHPLWALAMPPHMRFVRAFRQLMQSTDARTTSVREALRAYAINTVESLFRLPYKRQVVLTDNKALCTQMQYLCDAFETLPSHVRVFPGAPILLQTLQEQLQVPLAMDTGSYHEVFQDLKGITEEVCVGIDRLCESDFLYLNRGGRGWVRYTERLLYTRHLNVLSVHSTHQWSDWLLNEYLPIMHLIHKYAHVRPLRVNLYTQHLHSPHNVHYTEWQTVLKDVDIHIVPYRSGTPLEYTALPSWSTLRGANASAVAKNVCAAVRSVVALADASSPATKDNVTVRLQRDARAPSSAMSAVLQRFGVLDDHVVVMPHQSVFQQVASLSRAKRAFFMPHSDACMGLFVPSDANVVDLRHHQAGRVMAAGNDRTPRMYQDWLLAASSH